MSNSDYQQPDFYHFSEDSILLSHYLKSLNLKDRRILEIFAGSGVIGLEYSQNNTSLEELHFLELQPEFITSLKKNIERFLSPSVRHVIFNKSFHDHPPERYDLVISNPPYFETSSGRLPENLNKQMCHFLEESQFDRFILNMIQYVGLGARVFFLGRLDQNWIQRYMADDTIRAVVHFKKTSVFTLNKTH
jgi:tRNA1(Val) A37 N6-methylase TrmN6